MNRIFLMGNLTKDPETRSTQTGKTVTSFSVATNENYVDAQGNKQQKTEFHNVVAWGKQGEAIAKYLSKGRKILLEGKVAYSNFIGNDGTKKYKTDIVLSNFHFVDNKPEAQRDAYSQPEPKNDYSQPEPVDTGLPPVNAYGDEKVENFGESEISVEDIPF